MVGKEGSKLKWKSLIVIVVTAGVVSLMATYAQPKWTKEPALTALDYAEIQQLNAHYAHAIDSCAGNGEEWANLFTADGVFHYFTGTAEGREALRKVSGSRSFCAPPKNALTLRHIIVNVMIEPSSEGAIGKSYVMFANIGPDGKGGEIVGAGKYYDVYVKTPEGWRFKSRRYIIGQDVSLIPESELSHHPLAR